MQEAAEKFRKYAVNVERDLETLIFEMLDLIDSKTRTLRKLVKLHLHIKRVSLITNDRNLMQSSKQCLGPHRTSSRTLTSVCNSLSDNISLTTSTQDLLATRDSNYGGSDVQNGCETQEVDEIEQEIKAVGEGIKKIELPEIMPQEKQHNQNQPATLQNITKKVVEKLLAEIQVSQQRYQGGQEETENSKAKHIETGSKGAEEVDLDVAAGPDVPEEDARESGQVTPESLHPNSPANNPDGRSQISSRSSLNSYAILNNLEGVLNNLQGCQPGDCGFYLDPSTFTNIVDTLKLTIASCEISGCIKTPSHVKHSMGKSSTQPVLNVNLDGIPRRKTSSSPECEKHMQKRRVRS